MNKQGGSTPKTGSVDPFGPQQFERDASPALRAAIDALSGKPAASALRDVVVRLCEARWLTPRDIATILKRKDVSQLSEKHLAALVKDRKLERRYPRNQAHPSQAYRTIRKPAG